MFKKIVILAKELFFGKMEIDDSVQPAVATTPPKSEPIKYTKEELEKKTKGALVDLAKNEFDLKINVNQKKNDIIENILSHQ